MRASALLLVGLFLLRPELAPAGSVSEQRARLPPAKRCEDPIEGVWRSHKFRDDLGRWEQFTIEIHRKSGSESELEGSIKNDWWYAGAERAEPGKCDAAMHLRLKVSMPAVGEFRNGEVRFRGTKWKLDEVTCGPAPQPVVYYLDDFTGKVNPAIQEFQSVNNDGGTAVNDPTVFRRISCFEEEGPAPRGGAEVVPPPFFPSAKSTGC